MIRPKVQVVSTVHTGVPLTLMTIAKSAKMFGR